MKSLVLPLMLTITIVFFSSCEKDPVSTTITQIDTVRIPLPFPYPQIDSLTSFVTGLPAPVSLAIDAAGNIYAANPNTGIVSRITPEKNVQQFATAGTNIGAIAFSPSGDLYGSCYGDNTFKKVGPAGGLMVNVITGVNNPSGIAFDSVGNIFLGAYNQNVILRMTPGGSVTTYADIVRPSGLVFDRQGNLLVGDQGGHSIRKITPNGTQSVYSPAILSPHTLAYDLNGNLFVSSSNTDTKTVTVIATDGFTYQLSDQFTWPTGMVFDKSGALYVANYAGNSISKIVLTK